MICRTSWNHSFDSVTPTLSKTSVAARLPSNNKLTIPSSLQSDPTQSTQTTQSTQPRQPRQSQQTTRRLNPSVRRTLSQAELETQDSPRPTQRTSMPRSRGYTNTRGRGTRGRQGRGGCRQHRLRPWRRSSRPPAGAVVIVEITAGPTEILLFTGKHQICVF